MTGEFSLLIPTWPPTGNHAVRHTLTGGHYVTKETKEFRRFVGELVWEAKRLIGAPRLPLRGPLRLVVTAYPPDRRRRDLDNMVKPLQDALTRAGVYEDDCQIDQLEIVRIRASNGGGKVAITVAELEWALA